MDGYTPNSEGRIHWRSTDGTAWARLLLIPGECRIEFFQTNPQRQGNGRRALQELRSQATFICVVGVGGEGLPSRLFWEEMLQDGLVDKLIDDNGCVVPLESKGQK